MTLQINNNATAFNVFKSLNRSVTYMKESMSRLSNGTLDVEDDASAVGISERMRSQIRSTAMSRGNLDLSISMMQTADAWLQKTSDMLGRLHELAVEANDGTKSPGDVLTIQTEFTALQNEITRITSNATSAGKFNGLYLFRGGNGQDIGSGQVGSGTITVQIGPGYQQTIQLTLPDLQISNTSSIGTVSTYTYSTNGTVTGSNHNAVEWASMIDNSKLSIRSTEVIGKLQKAISFVANSRSQLGAEQVRLHQTRSGLLSSEDNLRTAESKIRDIDIARESTELSRMQVLSEIGNTMLSQANQLPNMAIELLG
ncbi:MAG: hypothetical protein HRT89_14240 [Lentisphaeria bacterium]|nr:hypothetical protein [Lentisphaeria bacterium]NQZ69216.1 hypothetical protein [Lentisphaeria bacterium]